MKAGEVCYFDEIGPYNLDFNYRDAVRSLSTEKTTNVWVNVDGVYDVTPAKVWETLQLTVSLITRFCGGTVEEMGIVE